MDIYRGVPKRMCKSMGGLLFKYFLLSFPGTRLNFAFSVNFACDRTNNSEKL